MCKTRLPTGFKGIRPQRRGAKVCEFEGLARSCALSPVMLSHTAQRPPTLVARFSGPRWRSRVGSTARVRRRLPEMSKQSRTPMAAAQHCIARWRPPKGANCAPMTFRKRLQQGRSARISPSLGRTTASRSSDLGVGGDTEVSPVRFDARCPQVLRNLIDMDAWRAGSSELGTTPLYYDGPSAGSDLVELIWSDTRSIPIVVISDQDGLVLHPDIAERMARDIAGLGMVVCIDHRAAWQFTEEKGREWSCYNGAIRLYWPVSSTPDEGPRRHPLWTATRLLSRVDDTRAAADRICNQIRRLILGQSAFSRRDTLVASRIRGAIREHEEAQREAERARAQEADDWEGLAEIYLADNDSHGNQRDALQENTRDLEESISDLKAQLRNAQQALRYSSDPYDVAPDEEVPPATSRDAFEAASERHGDVLVFGSDVTVGVSGMSDEAEPPEKVLYYLDQLAEMTQARNDGGLGTSATHWLAQRNVTASGESETIRNSPTEMQRRAWDDGTGERRQFERHLKPNDAAHPDLCVRIYHDYSAELGTTIVGWIGRHP